MPSSPNRFQPARAGIISLFEYDEQEFVFEDGHLLLRGNNGSGKSKALELLLPFVLDADMRPSRLDPFGDTAKSMRWNLLGDAKRALFRYEQRIGCVWLEFARLADTGEMRYLTVGAHLKGVREGDVTPTYFIITGKRVGVDVLLVHQNRPITRPVLAERLADCGELFATARDYKERVNQLLYGFASYERYTNMIDLALSLRRPHLSKKLNLAELNELLADALPEVSEQLVRRTADELDQIEHFRRQLDGLTSTHAALHSLERTYAKYAEAVLSQRARELRAAQRHVTELASQARRHETALRDAEQRQLDAETAVNDLSAAVLAADDVVEELLGSPEMKTAAELDTQRVSVELDEQRAVSAAEQLTGERARLQRAETAARKAADAVRNAHGELLRAHGELERAAERAGLAERHGSVREEMGDEADGMYRLLTREADSREENVAAQRHLRGIAREAARDAEQAARRRDDAFETLRHWREKVASLTATLEVDRDALLAAADTYLDALREISLSDEERDTVLARCSEAGPASAPDPLDPLRAAAGRARERLAEQRVSCEAQVAALAERRAPLDCELAALRADHDPEPDPLPFRARYAHNAGERPAAPGGPLWALVDFRDWVPDDQRALLEAALEASTLLDAWVTPDGSLMAGDVSLLPAVRNGRTLAEALTPVENDRVAWKTVDAVLRSVALDEEHAEVAVFADGRYRLGAAHGSHRKDAAQFIGSSARAANRQARITVLEAELALIEAACGELASEIGRLAERVERTREEERAFPADALAPILAGARNLDVALSREQHALGEHADFEQRAERDAAAARAAANAADAHARGHRLPLPGTQPDLDTLDKALRAYARDIVMTAGAARDLARDRAHSEETAGTFTELNALVQQLDGDTRRLQEHAGARRAAYETARELHGAEVEVAQNRLRDAKKHRVDLADERRDAESAVKTAIREAGETLGELRQARSELTLANTRRGTAFGALVECERADLFRLALHEHAPEDHAQAAGWPLERALDVAGVCATALDAPAANGSGTSDGAAPGLASGLAAERPPAGLGRAAPGTVLSARGRWSLTSSTGCSAPTWRTVAT